MCDGNRHADGRSETVDSVSADRKPESGIEEVGGVRADIGEFESLNRAVVGGFERAFVFEGQDGAGILASRRSGQSARVESCVLRSGFSGLFAASTSLVMRSELFS